MGIIETIVAYILAHLGLVLVLCAIWLFFSDAIKAGLTNGGNWIAAAVSAGTQVASPAGQAQVQALASEVEQAIAALHTVTEYAISTGSPDLVTEVSALYTSITSLIKAHNAPPTPAPAPAPQIIYVTPVAPPAPAPAPVVPPAAPVVVPAPVTPASAVAQ